MDDNNLAQPTEVTEIQTPSDSPTENKGEGTEPSQGGETGSAPINTPVEDNIPFHKHPRWLAQNREIEDLKGQLAGYESLKGEIESIKNRPAPNAQDPELPDWWKDAFGTDEASKKAYLKQLEHEQRLFADWETKILDKVRESHTVEAQKQEAEVKKWEGYIAGELQTLTDKGYKFDKNELLKIVDDYSKDAKGNYTGYLFPFEKAYEILQLKKATPSPTSKARQDAAGKSVAGTGSGSPTPTMPTVTDIRQRGWGAWRGND